MSSLNPDEIKVVNRHFATLRKQCIAEYSQQEIDLALAYCALKLGAQLCQDQWDQQTGAMINCNAGILLQAACGKKTERIGELAEVFRAAMMRELQNIRRQRKEKANGPV